MADQRPDVLAAVLHEPAVLRGEPGDEVDPLVVAGPWVAGAGVAVLGARRLARALRG